MYLKCLRNVATYCLRAHFCNDAKPMLQFGNRKQQIYKVVLTGGPCGGKSTGQTRLATFFENLGWKVYRVPETANILLSGAGINFSTFSNEQACNFQENVLKTMLQIEQTYFDLANELDQKCLIICDRGAMDASAYIDVDSWNKIMDRNGCNSVELRDNRYNHVINMVSVAKGAEAFYTTIHSCRDESIEHARELEHRTASAWIGHPYYDVVDNSTDFDLKITRMIACVCERLGIDTKDRLATNSRKVKFLVKSLPPDNLFPSFQDFDVVLDYLVTPSKDMQARVRKRGQNGNWTYLHSVRRPENGQLIEHKMQISGKEYQNMLVQKSLDNLTVYKMRRCFLWQDQYFQLDVYREPCHPRCKNLMVLETYTTLEGDKMLKSLPPFIELDKEVSDAPSYSMFNLSLRQDWSMSSSNNLIHDMATNIADR